VARCTRVPHTLASNRGPKTAARFIKAPRMLQHTPPPTAVRKSGTWVCVRWGTHPDPAPPPLVLHVLPSEGIRRPVFTELVLDTPQEVGVHHVGAEDPHPPGAVGQVPEPEVRGA
jgi:hypothetical protein